MKFLETKKALVMGVANDHSLGWSIAQSLKAQGADVGFSYGSENLEKRVRPLAESIDSSIVDLCNVDNDEHIESLFSKVKEKWGHLDILIHSIAFAKADELENRFVKTSREGFQIALNTSVYSLIAVANKAETLMEGRNGTILTLSNYGAERVIPNYNVMGVAKAALESAVRYLAYDLGPKKIKVNAISAGPIKTLSAGGIKDFRSFLNLVEEKSPLHENITGADVGNLAAFLCGAGGNHITGTTIHIDSGTHIMGA